MRVCHEVIPVFDDPNLVSCGGLVPVLDMAERAGLHDLVATHVRLGGRPGGVFAEVKVSAIIAGMMAGADSIDDLALLRHGAMKRLFGGVRAPSTLGTFLRAFTFGHVRQLDAVNARLLPALARAVPLLPDAGVLAYVDVDDTMRATYGYQKQGAGRGYTGVKGLNALIATISTPGSQPVLAGVRLRRGGTHSVRGAHHLIANALVTATACGATGTRVLRADSAYYARAVIQACERAGAAYSITARQDTSVRRRIAGIPETAWTTIRYPHALYDEVTGQWVSDAEVAETEHTAFTGGKQADRVTARLVVRRVKDANPSNQSEMFTVWRYHAVFTTSPLPMLEAEKAHRAHAIIETVIADLKNGPLAHLPSGSFAANSAWLACTAIAHNLLRAAGARAGSIHANATTATLRARLITVPARLARTGRKHVLHLPANWPWAQAFQALFEPVAAPPPTRA